MLAGFLASPEGGGAIAVGALVHAIPETNKHAVARPIARYICLLYEVPNATRTRAKSSPESIPNASVLSNRSAAIGGSRNERIFGSKDLFVMAVPMDTAIRPPSVRNWD
jgi:hypothetical protein